MLTGVVMGGTGSVLGGGNFWMGAGQGLIVTAFNFLAHDINEGGLNQVANQNSSSTNRPSKSNRRLERLERQGKVRFLTENEIALAKSVFGDEIDYLSVKIIRAKYVFIQGKNYAVTPNGNIYFPMSEADWTFSLSFRDLFIHEMTHVWQYQIGINVFMKALPLQILKFGTLGLIDPYTLPQNNINFQFLNVEQQGSYMEGVNKGIYNNPFNK